MSYNTEKPKLYIGACLVTKETTEKQGNKVYTVENRIVVARIIRANNWQQADLMFKYNLKYVIANGYTVSLKTYGVALTDSLIFIDKTNFTTNTVTHGQLH